MPSDIALKELYLKSYYHCNCAITNKNDPWYNARDYCENCQNTSTTRAEGEFRCVSAPNKVCNPTLKRKKRRKYVNNSTNNFLNKYPSIFFKRPSTICTTNCRYDIIRDVAHSFGMRELSDGWNVYWTDLSITHDRCKEMKRYQRINHFPGMLEICRKDLLTRNLNKMQKLFPNDYNFYPKSWCLPVELNEVLEFCKTHRNKAMIIKPDIGCQGKGIIITKNLNDLKGMERVICQLYITKPFLIDGYKFDLRVYVLITSCDPLRIYVYNEGLVRFATKRYKEPNGSNICNMYMHLTNYSVNKHNSAYVHDAEGGSKRRISTINQWLTDRFYNIERLWKAVDDVVVKTIIVSLPNLKHSYQACFPNHITTQACFELLGFDFILDSKMNPHLLEVNHSPSFHTETDIDLEIKESLLNDTFKLLNLASNEKQKILAEDRRRIKERLLGTADKKPLADKYEERYKIHEESMKSIFEWECSHLGNYRQIYPSENDMKYEAFFTINHSSPYSDTQSSKAKEVNKLNKDEQGKDCRPFRSPKNNKDISKVTPIKKNDVNVLSQYDPVLINESDEEERIADLRKREKLIYNHGVLEKVYNGLKEAGRLQIEDEIRYGRNNNWTHQNRFDDENSNGNKAKKNLQEIFRILVNRGLFLSSQEIPLTNTMIKMNLENEVNFKKFSILRNTPESSPGNSPSVCSSLISLSSKSEDRYELPKLETVVEETAVETTKPLEKRKNTGPLIKENEAIINGLKITCNETILNEEPWIMISSKSCN